ncbi:hypothetical protein GMST_34770 [Geomonas silvestris]|uniref:Uncharacterized protein n=1 Tax=Geomonas silvestris TaxID=2740184 RepID=A0A6V8MMG1_9BACT|nr:hypothetical protein GMST_34770 [Geomonas silvestris]
MPGQQAPERLEAEHEEKEHREDPETLQEVDGESYDFVHVKSREGGGGEAGEASKTGRMRSSADYTPNEELRQTPPFTGAPPRVAGSPDAGPAVHQAAVPVLPPVRDAESVKRYRSAVRQPPLLDEPLPQSVKPSPTLPQ